MELKLIKNTIDHLREVGCYPDPLAFRFRIPEAKKDLCSLLRYHLGEKARWKPEYDEIVEWLSDNQGRGLLCYGGCGLGKTEICWKCIPILMHYHFNRIVSCYSAQEMNEQVDEILNKGIIYIDDVGTESLSVKFGNRRMAFCEIVDACERKGTFLMVSTNLSLADIAEKYGERTMDRLIAITKPVKFEGKSMRR